MRDCDSATDKIYIFTKIISVTYISGNKSPIENKQICFSRCDESMSVKVEFPPLSPVPEFPELPDLNPCQEKRKELKAVTSQRYSAVLFKLKHVLLGTY
jgi:hypothetical protein